MTSISATHVSAPNRASPTTRSRPLRIAVLELDIPIPELYTTYGGLGGYGAMFKRLLEGGAADLAAETGADIELDVSAFNVVERNEYPDLDGVDAVLMTGSKHDAWADEPWINDLVVWTAHTLLPDARVPLLGVCFGHQILARALGARVGRSSSGWEISAVSVDLSEIGREYFGRERLALYQLHRDVVFELPSRTGPDGVGAGGEEADGVRVLNLGSTDRCAIHGLVLPGRFISVQGHPEFDARYMETMIDVRHGLGIIDDHVYRDGRRRLGDKCEGRLVAKVFVRFALHARADWQRRHGM